MTAVTGCSRFIQEQIETVVSSSTPTCTVAYCNLLYEIVFLIINKSSEFENKVPDLEGDQDEAPERAGASEIGASFLRDAVNVLVGYRLTNVSPLIGVYLAVHLTRSLMYMFTFIFPSTPYAHRNHLWITLATHRICHLKKCPGWYYSAIMTP